MQTLDKVFVVYCIFFSILMFGGLLGVDLKAFWSRAYDSMSPVFSFLLSLSFLFVPAYVIFKLDNLAIMLYALSVLLDFFVNKKESVLLRRFSFGAGLFLYVYLIKLVWI